MDDENEKKSNKSKTVFKTSCCALSKLAEQAKIHIILCNFKGFICDEKFYL
jgi:hypothetical protein